MKLNEREIKIYTIISCAYENPSSPNESLTFIIEPETRPPTLG